MADEMLGPILLTAHNLTYYQRLLAGARAAIEQDRFVEYYDQKIAGWAKSLSLLKPDLKPQRKRRKAGSFASARLR